jgi:hypothetical protein
MAVGDDGAALTRPDLNFQKVRGSPLQPDIITGCFEVSVVTAPRNAPA